MQWDNRGHGHALDNLTDVNTAGGSKGDVLTRQADGSYAPAAPSAGALRGSAQIDDPDTSVAVNADIGETAESGEIQVTPVDDTDGWLDGAASAKFGIKDLSSTGFTIAVDAAPGTGKHAGFHWLWAPADLADAYDPLAIAWHTAFWAEDPNWSDPGDGGSVSQWDDGSGNGRHATQGTASAQPTYRSSVAAFGNQPAVQFDGDDFLETASFTALTNPYTIVVVATATANGTHIFDGLDGTDRAGLFRISSGSGNWAISNADGTSSTGSVGDSSAHLFICTFTATDLLDIDGANDISSNVGADDLTGLTLGARFDQDIELNGHIAFFGLFDGDLSSSDRSELLSWAQSHYGTP